MEVGAKGQNLRSSPTPSDHAEAAAEADRTGSPPKSRNPHPSKKHLRRLLPSEPGVLQPDADAEKCPPQLPPRRPAHRHGDSSQPHRRRAQRQARMAVLPAHGLQPHLEPEK